jgi:ATP-dependent Lhr-like helicase
MPYAFLDDAPLEERRARAVSLRRALPDDSRDLARLDPAAISRESENAWPRVRDVDELHDALLILGLMPEDAASKSGTDESRLNLWLQELTAAGRAYRLELSQGSFAWAAAERLPWLRLVFPETLIEPDPPDNPPPAEATREDAVLSLVRGWVECIGPFTTDGISQTLSLPLSDVAYAVAQLENDGTVLRGSFTPGADQEEFCDRRILARIHRSTIDSLRSQVEPVPPATFVRFLLQWQHVDLPSRLSGEGGLLAVIEELQGFEIAAAAVEEEILTSRLADFSPLALDRLCLGGEVVWGRVSSRQNGTSQNGTGSHPPRAAFSKSTPITLALRDALDWLLNADDPGTEGLSGAAKETLNFMGQRGASFLSDIVSATKRLPTDVEEALWTLAASGRVTSDGLEALRQRIRGTNRPRRNSKPGAGRGNLHRRRGFSRWSVLEPVDPVEDRTEAVARQLLLRYGLLFPELLARDALAVRWRDLVRVLRRLEARGEIRGGRFVAGFVGEQFALPEAVDLLRRLKGQEPDGRFVVVSACDPLNLAGILTPGNRVTAVLGNRLVYRDGVPIAAMEGGSFVPLSNTEGTVLEQAWTLLGVPIVHAAYQLEQTKLATA